VFDSVVIFAYSRYGSKVAYGRFSPYPNAQEMGKLMRRLTAGILMVLVTTVFVSAGLASELVSQFNRLIPPDRVSQAPTSFVDVPPGVNMDSWLGAWVGTADIGVERALLIRKVTIDGVDKISVLHGWDAKMYSDGRGCVQLRNASVSADGVKLTWRGVSGRSEVVTLEDQHLTFAHDSGYRIIFTTLKRATP